MEAIRLTVDPEAYDRVLRDCPPEGGDLELVVKRGATESGKAAVLVHFTVKVRGKLLGVQAVTTLAALRAVVDAIPADW